MENFFNKIKMKISNSRWSVGLLVVFFFMGCENEGWVKGDEPAVMVSEVVEGDVIPSVDETLTVVSEEVVVEEKVIEEVVVRDEEVMSEEAFINKEEIMHEEKVLREEELMHEEKVMRDEKFKRDELGLNVVSEEGAVLNEEGAVARTDVKPLSKEAPQQSGFLTEEEVPDESIVLEISKALGYVPNEFTVNRGEAITLVIKSVDEKVHIFRFKDDSLKAIAVGLSGDEMRAISFNVPDKAGEYEYFSDVPGQKDKIGKMIVK